MRAVGERRSFRACLAAAAREPDGSGPLLPAPPLIERRGTGEGAALSYEACADAAEPLPFVEAPHDWSALDDEALRRARRFYARLLHPDRPRARCTWPLARINAAIDRERERRLRG